MNSSLRGIRIVVYLTTIMYALINSLSSGPSFIEMNVMDPTPLSSSLAATAVGVIQLGLALAGLIIDVPARQFALAIKWILGGLVFTYMYELVLILIYDPSPFRWVPFLVYTALCAVLYIAEDN